MRSSVLLTAFVLSSAACTDASVADAVDDDDASVPPVTVDDDGVDLEAPTSPLAIALDDATIDPDPPPRLTPEEAATKFLQGSWYCLEEGWLDNYLYFTEDLHLLFDYARPPNEVAQGRAPWCRKHGWFYIDEVFEDGSFSVLMEHTIPAIPGLVSATFEQVDDQRYGPDILAADLINPLTDEEPDEWGQGDDKVDFRCWKCSDAFGDLSGCPDQPASPWPMNFEYDAFLACPFDI